MKKLIGMVSLAAGCMALTHPALATATAAPATAMSPTMAAAQALASAPPPAAPDAASLMRDCVKWSDRADRLVCFDKATVALGLASAAQVADQANVLKSYGFWQIATKTDAMKVETVTLRLNANSDVEMRTRPSVRPSLVVTCANRQTDLYFDFKSGLRTKPTDKTFPVTLKIEANPPVQASWQISSDGYAIYAPDSAAVIRALRDQQVATFELIPPDETTRTVAFDLNGMKPSLDVLIQRCYR